MKNSKLLIAGLLVACGSAEPETQTASASQVSNGGESPGDQVSVTLAHALEHPERNPENSARDVYRHPKETLSFFGLKPDMQVLELWPGRGWYTEVLAPVLAEKGSLTVAMTDPKADGHRGELAREMTDWFSEQPERFGKVQSVVLAAPKAMELGSPGTYDMAVTFRSTHNWINDGVEQEVYQAVFDALAPGGTFGVVQHRAPEGADPKVSAKHGYVPEAYVIELATKAGFVLEDSSDINANPADTKDYPDGVWTLPPSLRGPEAERERFMEIGESDRMTLRFRKPSNDE